jgi:hypothetical protein
MLGRVFYSFFFNFWFNGVLYFFLNSCFVQKVFWINFCSFYIDIVFFREKD